MKSVIYGQDPWRKINRIFFWKNEKTKPNVEEWFHRWKSDRDIVGIRIWWLWGTSPEGTNVLWIMAEVYQTLRSCPSISSIVLCRLISAFSLTRSTVILRVMSDSLLLTSVSSFDSVSISLWNKKNNRNMPVIFL